MNRKNKKIKIKLKKKKSSDLGADDRLIDERFAKHLTLVCPLEAFLHGIATTAHDRHNYGPSVEKEKDIEI
jgi:hypothetical protein